MVPLKKAPKETGSYAGFSKYDKIAVEKDYGCIKNGKRVKKKKVANKEKCNTEKGFRTMRENRNQEKQSKQNDKKRRKKNNDKKKKKKDAKKET